MLKQVRGPAYRALNRILGLKGSQNVAATELGESVLTHDLGKVVQAGLADRMTWGVQINAATGVSATSIRPDFDPDWDLISRDRAINVNAPDLDEEQILITHMGVQVPTNPGQLDRAMFVESGAFVSIATGASVPITSELDTQLMANPSGTPFGPAAGTAYYVRPMPFWIHWGTTLQIYLDVNTAATDVDVVLFGYAAPWGVIEYPGNGS